MSLFAMQQSLQRLRTERIGEVRAPEVALPDGMTILPADASTDVAAAYPQSLVLDWTDYCNAKCFFCYREKYEQEIGGRGEFIPFARLKKLEKVLSRIKFFGISSAIGEPLLHPELQQILEWLYSINPNILIRTTTNGTALMADKAAWFAGHLDWLSVSLNASNGEAHLRDMFPHLVKRGIDAQKRWELHLRHLKEFMEALSAEDRRRIRFQMVAHRYNVKDIVDFIRVVERLGGSHAVITNIAVHAETVDWSLYWIKDLYNEAVDEAREVGTRLGIQVDAARFYTSIKPVLDLDEVCRDPIDIAYISRASVGAPCCQWTEAGIPTDVYTDEEGFERYWNDDVLRRLRQKRNFESCHVCGLSRVFDETSFHLSPKLKQQLIGVGRLSEIENQNDYPDATLVRTCNENGLDLPMIRHSLLQLSLPVENAGQIEVEGLAALPALEQACWEAFKNVDLRRELIDIPLAGPFLGIGWGLPIHEPQNRVSARWLSGSYAGSVFVQVEAGVDYGIAVTLHHVHPHELAWRLELQVCDRPIETWLSQDDEEVLRGIVPGQLTRLHEGRLWIRVGCLSGERKAFWNISFKRFMMSKASKTAVELEQHLAKKDSLVREQALRIAELERQITDKAQELSAKEQELSAANKKSMELASFLQEMHGSTSWRLTAPLRKLVLWLRG
jgi:MoaA/NifB/PqqE/SkfB family radical SAM enzyme